jgi:prevent-host-death family protein
MLITLTALKENTGYYVDMADKEEIIITRNGKPAAKLVPAKIDRKESVKALIGTLPEDIDYDKLRAERIVK